MYLLSEAALSLIPRGRMLLGGFLPLPYGKSYLKRPRAETRESIPAFGTCLESGIERGKARCCGQLDTAPEQQGQHSLKTFLLPEACCAARQRLQKEPVFAVEQTRYPQTPEPAQRLRRRHLQYAGTEPLHPATGRLQHDTQRAPASATPSIRIRNGFHSG